MNQTDVRKLLEYRDGKLYWRVARGPRKIGDEAGLSGPLGYRQVTCNGKPMYRGRLVWIYFYGEIPKGMQIDHINRDPADDRIENLRLVTRQQICQSRGKRTNGKSSQFIGVRLLTSITKKYEAAMMVGKVRMYLGIFEEAADAAQAYNFAVAKYKPDYGVYNGAENVLQEF